MPADIATDVLLICCASGKQSTHLLQQVAPKWKRLRLQAHSDASVKSLRDRFPDAEVVQADFGNPNDAARILDGVTTVWYLSPAFTVHEIDVGHTMVDAAVHESQKPGAKLQHFVYSSVLQTQLRKLINHDSKRYVEEYLMESGLSFTILQPSHFLNIFPIQALAQQDEPVYRTPYGLAPHKFSFTIYEDYAPAAAKVLEERERHYFAQYPLLSTYPMLYADIVKQASGVLGKDIKVERLSLEQGIERLPGASKDPKFKDGAERLLLYYNRRGLVGSPTVMEWLLKRKAMGTEEWMEMHVDKVRRAA